MAASAEASGGRFVGTSIVLPGSGAVRLSEVLSAHGETGVYRCDRPGVIVKVFDLECGKPDEISYAPFVAFNLERENFEDIRRIGPLSRWVPAFYGAAVDYERRFAFLAMEYLEGQTLLEWCLSAIESGYPEGWFDEFRAVIHETLAILTLFHEHGIILIDFKPDNVIRLHDRRVKFVDLGAFYTPRHNQGTEGYVYSATPDYSELVTDTSNIQTGIPLNQASDIFSTGISLFEMITGRSRVAVSAESAREFLATPEMYLFRDSQIRDVWKAYPHLKELLPLIETQLKDGEVLFSEIWHLLKGYLAFKVPGWETMPEAEHQRMILESGRDLIADQLPPALGWLADAIARATTLRAMRLKSVAELKALIASPVDEETRRRLTEGTGLLGQVRDMGESVSFVGSLNRWEVRSDPKNGGDAILIPAVSPHLGEASAFVFLKQTHAGADGHRYYRIVSDVEADELGNRRLALSDLAEDHSAWVEA